LAPPLCAIIVLAVFTKRINEKGAFYGLFIGLIVGMIRFIWEYSYTVPPCAKKYLDNRPAIITEVHYLHFRIILFAITVFVAWMISFLTKPIQEKYVVKIASKFKILPYNLII
jgi:Na+(H+)/acetate symporter ActP